MDDRTGRKAVEVLLVEDDQGDVVLITDAIRQVARWFLELVELPRLS